MITSPISRLQSETPSWTTSPNALLDWLAAPNPSSNYNSGRDEHQPETGLWLLENPVYLEWKDSPASLLWLHGKAGCGETILSSTVIHDLFSQDPARLVSGCICFYFDFQIHETQWFEKCLCSLLVQLIGKDPNALKVLKRLYNAHSNGGATPGRGSLIESLSASHRRNQTSVFGSRCA